MRFKVPIANQSSMARIYALWLILLVLSFSLQAGEQVASWRYDRLLIQHGQFWLLFSGHLVHSGWAHWGLNMAGLAIVAFFFSVYATLWQWLVVITLSALCVGLGLLWLNPDVATYVGLSGVLHGLFVYGAVRECRSYPLSGYVLLALLAAKLLWELCYGALPGSEELTAGRVITDAHLYGAIGGLFAVLLVSARGLFDQLVEVENRQQDAEHDE